MLLPWQGYRFPTLGRGDPHLLPRVDAMVLRNSGGCTWEDPSRARWFFDQAADTRTYRLRDFVATAGIRGLAPMGFHDLDLIAAVKKLIERGDLVGVYLEVSGGAKAKAADRATQQRQLVWQIDEEARGKLSYSGRSYKLTADVDLGGLPDRDRYEVVGQRDAKRILDELAHQPGTSAALAGLLAKARDQLTPDWRPPLQPNGLILFRRVIAPRATTVDTGPAITPSEMKALLAPATDEEPTIRLVNIEAPTFVPGVETIRISYAIDGPVPKATAVSMMVESVPAKGGRTVVETLAIAGPYAASGEILWDGKAGTPGGFITLKGSPYEVTFELTSTSGKTSRSKAGTIRVEVKQIKIVVDDTGPLDVADPWKPTVSALVAELKKSGMPGDCAGRVIVDSPLFKVNDTLDMDDATSFLEYQKAAGSGAAIPLLAEITLKCKSGEGKRSAPVLLGTRLLWDFKLEASADLDASLGGRGVPAATKTFVKTAASFEESATQPNGTSAHVKVGGFRAKSADRATAGRQWTAGSAWTLTPPAKRDWAAFTSCGDGPGDRADSGVYFTPGRMAGDTHKVRAILDVDEALDVLDQAAPDGAPAPHRSNTVKLTTWRRIPIVATWIVGAKTTPPNVVPLTAEYKKAAMLMEPAPGVAPQDIGGKWSAEYKSVVDGYVKVRDPFLSKALEVDPQGYPVRYRDFIDYWELINPDAGFFGALWERIRNFFGASDEDEYKKKCEKKWYDVMEKVAKRVPIPDKGITAVKFGHNGPHNQNPTPGSFTAGVAPSISGLTGRQKAIFFQFTASDDPETFIHEVGHVLFLAHAPGHFTPGKQPGGFQPDAHDKNEVCIMSYSSAKKVLCGLCVLKLAGWNYLQVSNDGNIKP